MNESDICEDDHELKQHLPASPRQWESAGCEKYRKRRRAHFQCKQNIKRKTCLDKTQRNPVVVPTSVICPTRVSIKSVC